MTVPPMTGAVGELEAYYLAYIDALQHALQGRTLQYLGVQVASPMSDRVAHDGEAGQYAGNRQ